MSLKKVCLKWCDWTMIYMLQSHILHCHNNFSFAFDYDMSCVLFILKILKCMYRGFRIEALCYFGQQSFNLNLLIGANITFILFLFPFVLLS